MPPKQPEVRLAPETIDYLEERIAGAMGRVLGDALTDDNARRIFRIGLQVMREEAASHTGKLVLGGMAGLAKLVFWAAVGLTAVYTLGGWGLVKAIWAPGK